ncbi:unnamed protein product [Cylindrotheca closterium]|uniref:Uncharacterized protein n=1 Tax=Cylindrotheca closterium TaxID=2856 RepID=A0AAD2JL69_9STRA|nr:unnamed protein product [Cylindrotheca closterium]
MTEQPKPESSFSLKQSKIRFSEKLEEYHYIPSRNDFSERELRHCWYTEEEKAKYIERHERSSKRLENGERSKRGESFRGLEGWTQDGADEANEMIEECLDAVLHEQQRQWRKNRRNPINLALISESKSKKSIKMALRTAKRDTKEALRAYERMGIEDLDLESATSSISSLMASMPASSSSVEDSDENEPDKPRRTEKREGKRRSTSKRRSSAYRSRGEHRRSKSTSSSTSRGVERIQKAIALE